MKKFYQCKNCGTIYTSDLGVCPQCFTSHKKGNGKMALEILFLCLVIVVSVVGAVSLISSDSSEAPDNTSYTAEKPDDSSSCTGSIENPGILTIGSTLSADGLNITLEKAEDWNSNNLFIQPENGKKFIRVYFTLENTNNSSRFLGSYDFSCYADNAKAKDRSIYGNDVLSLGTEISKGRALQGYITPKFHLVPPGERENVPLFEKSGAKTFISVSPVRLTSRWRVFSFCSKSF